MKTTIAILSALAAIAQALQFDNSEVNPVADEPFTVLWSGTENPVNIVLKTGPRENLDTVMIVAANVSGGSVDVVLNSEDFPSGTYAFEIVDTVTEEVNYSIQFPLVGNGELDPEEEEEEEDSSTSLPTIVPTPSETNTTAAPTTTETADDDQDVDDDEDSTTTDSDGPSPTADSDESSDTDVPGAADRVSSPLALILVTIASMVYFN